MPAAARNIREQNLTSIASAREGAQQAAELTRQAAAATQESIRTAVEAAARTFQNSTEQIGQALGVSGQHGAEIAQQSTRNIDAVSQCSAILMRGFQEISREWLGLAQHRSRETLKACRLSPPAEQRKSLLQPKPISCARTSRRLLRTVAGSRRCH
jgi:hypothetical protein